jgi:hypothetical protein
MAVSTKMAVFWVVAPCSLVEVHQRFRGPCCLHHQGDLSSPTLLNFYHTTRRYNPEDGHVHLDIRTHPTLWNARKRTSLVFTVIKDCVQFLQTRRRYIYHMPHYIMNRTPWSRALLEKLIITQLIKKLATFYGTHRFTCSEDPTIGSYPKLHESSPHTPTLFL